MKLLLALTLFSAFLLVGCSEEQTNFQLSNPEVFGYATDIEGEWDVNTSVIVKGYTLEEKENNKFQLRLSYTINLVQPDGTVQKSVASKQVNEQFGEKIADYQIEDQFKFTSKTVGKYKVQFIVTDETSAQTSTIEKEFDLE